MFLGEIISRRSYRAKLYEFSLIEILKKLESSVFQNKKHFVIDIFIHTEVQ